MRSVVRLTPLPIAVACALASLPRSPAALALSETTLEGRHRLTGVLVARANEPAEADVTIERVNGALRVTRSAVHAAARPGARATWVAEGRAEEGGLSVTFRVPLDAATPGVVGALNGAPRRDDARENVIVARYTRSLDGALTEELVNTTRVPPDEWTEARLRTAGVVARVKLGGTVPVQGERVNVVVPTDGCLTLTVSRGRITRVLAPDGSVACTGTGSIVVHEAKRVGEHVVELEGARGGELRAQLVQVGRVGDRSRPWSTHTFYPVHELDHDGEPNPDALFVRDGPLEKFDRAFGLIGMTSAAYWEKGLDYRSDVGFNHGHYTRTIRPEERNAERDWKADLNGDGAIAGDAAGTFALMDADRDGKVDLREARAFFRSTLIGRLFREYDGDGDGALRTGEIGTAFVARYGRGASVSRDDFRAAVERDFPAVLAQADGQASALVQKSPSGTVSFEDVESWNAIDFLDDLDADGDGRTFFDRDNVVVHARNGSAHAGNRVIVRGDRTLVYKGRAGDLLVADLPSGDVARVERGVADGDLGGSYSVGWWGHCNAWAIASILFPRPTRAASVGGQSFSVRDQKALLVELAMGDVEESTFSWSECGDGRGGISSGPYAARLHRQLRRWLRDERRGLFGDMELKAPGYEKDFQVWNYPLIGYEATLAEAPGDDPYVLSARVVVEKASYSDDEDTSTTTDLSYVLHFDGEGDVREDAAARTAWTTTALIDGEERPAFLRYLAHPFRVVGRGRSGNPAVTQERVERVVGTAGNGLPLPTADGR